MKNSTHFLDTDNDCHWYVVPLERRAEWEAWLELPYDDERAGEAPDYADPVSGNPNRVTFMNHGYTIGDE